jgi:hypothetical protein
VRAGQTGNSCSLSAAGGGAVGRIRVNTAGGFAPRGGAIVSPPATTGVLD